MDVHISGGRRQYIEILYEHGRRQIAKTRMAPLAVVEYLYDQKVLLMRAIISSAQLSLFPTSLQVASLPLNISIQSVVTVTGDSDANNG